MMQLFEKGMDLIGKANQLLQVPFFTKRMDGFDSSNGVRYYVVKLFQILSVVILITLLVAISKEFMSYFNNGSHDGKETVASFITFVICIYAAFPLSQIVRSRGEDLNADHTNMVTFIFHDVAKMAIRMVGELTAMSLFFVAICTTVATVFNTSAFIHVDAMQLLSSLIGFVGQIMMAIAGLIESVMGIFHINMDMQSFFLMGEVKSDGLVDGSWTSEGVKAVAMSYITVIMSLIALYFSLTIYHYIYSLGSSLFRWIANPSIPMTIKNK